MKKYLPFVLFVFCSSELFAQANRSFDLDVFDGIRIEGPYNVKAMYGSPKVELTGDDEILDNTIVKIDRGTLIIRFEGNRWGRYNEKVDVDLQFDQIESIDLSGAAQMYVRDRLEADRFELDISGASEVEFSIDANEIIIDASGASEAKIDGRVEVKDIDLSGASRLIAGDLRSQDCNIECSGASSATINVERDLRADASGASTVRYYGNPEYVNSDASGASSVRRKN